MRRLVQLFGIVLFSAFMLNLDCQETLPPYAPPDSIYSLVFRADQPDLDFVHRSIDDIAVGKGGFGFNMDLTNLFDETLYGSAEDTLGQVFIWWEDDPAVQATLILTPLHEIVTHELMDQHSVFFDPGDSIRLAIVWMDWKDDQGSSMWDHVNGSDHDGRIFYGPMDFIAQARIQLFAETPDIYSNQVRFSVTFYKDNDE